MAIKSGFFNASNHDRMYNAEDFGDVLSMAITDGVDNVYLDKMIVTAGSGLTVNVGTGRAFFNGHYVINDSAYNLSLEAASTNLSRIDAIIIDVKGADAYREVTLDVIKGTASSSPVKPTLIKNDGQKRWQYALAYVTIPAGAVNVLAANIEDVRGTSECPWIIKTGAYDSVLSSASINAPQTKVVKAAIDNANTNTANGLKDAYKVMGYNGAKNLYDINIGYNTQNNGLVEKTENSIRVYNTTQGSRAGYYTNAIKVSHNVSMTLSLSAIYTSGVGSVEVYANTTDSTSGLVFLAQSGSITSNKNVNFTFNTSSYNYIRIFLVCTLTASTGDLTYQNIMLRYNDDTDTTYQPYAMTNKELTPSASVNDLSNATASTLEGAVAEWIDKFKGTTDKYNITGHILKTSVYEAYIYCQNLMSSGLAKGLIVSNSVNIYTGYRYVGSNAVLTELAPKSSVKDSTRATYTGKTLPNNIATEFTLNFPSGYTYDNCQIVSVALVYNNTRYYMGLNGSVHTYIGEVYMTSSGIIVRAVNSTSSQITCNFEIGLQKV